MTRKVVFWAIFLLANLVLVQVFKAFPIVILGVVAGIIAWVAMDVRSRKKG